MSETKDIISQITRELERLIKPLILAGVDASVRKNLLDTLGWELDTLIGFPVTQLSNDINAISTNVIALANLAANEPKSFDDISASLKNIKSIFTALNDLSQLGQNGSLNASPDVKAALTTLGDDIIQLLVIDYLDRYRPEVLHVARILTLIQTPGDDLTFTPEMTSGTATSPMRISSLLPRLRLDRLGPLLRDPAAYLRNEYLGTRGLATEEDARRVASILFSRIGTFLISLGATISDGSDVAGSENRDSRRTIAFRFMLPTDGTTTELGAIVRLIADSEGGAGIIIAPTGWVSATWDFRWWSVSLKSSGQIGELTIRPDGVILPSIMSSFDLELSLKRWSPDGKPAIIVGAPTKTRLELGSVALTFSLSTSQNDWDIGIEGLLENGAIVIAAGDGDGFLNHVLPDGGFKIDLDLAFGWTRKKGLHFRGSSGLEIKLPVHINVGPIDIQSATIAIKPTADKIPIELGATLKVNIGPLVAVLDNMGLKFELSFPSNGGNLGPVDLDIAFKPPNGVGLSIDTGVVKGGGFLRFNYDKGEYFGALELSIKNTINLKAVGIINTKMPDGSPGFALLILITAEFTPIQLGMGFSLMGVGGLLGLNRSTNIEALKTGVKTGAVSSILFPKDVVANITRIISDLTTIFPIVEAHFIIAPMGKLGWFTPPLITLEMGIIIDIPSPTLVIIGVLRCVLPEEKSPVLKLQVNFAGGIDFDKGLIWFDASLFDSSILVYTLTGDMALRIGWGDNPLFILSVGGFHPAFHEVPPDLTNMTRLTLSLLSGNNPRLVAQTYFAVTSNTVQSGAKVELYAEACGFNVYGFLGYDLLVQFNPLYFIADIYAGLALRSGSNEIAGINVHCELSGPTPWHALGDASLKILFFKVTVGFDHTWGDSAPPQTLEAEDVLKLLTDALEDGRNWKTDLPANTNQSVSVKKIDLAPGEIILHPFGVLQVSQKVVPLKLTINKFGNKQPAADTLFDITYSAGNTAYVEEEFAPAQFLQMADNEKLARKSFEKMKSGLRFQGSDATSHGFEIDKDVTYELIYVHKKKFLSIKAGIFKMFNSVFNIAAKGNAITKNSYSASKRKASNAPAKVDVSSPGYKVVTVSDMQEYTGTVSVATEAEAYEMHDALIAKTPSLQGTIQVMSNSELNYP